MKLKMAENSLFAILLRSSWWISLAIALGIVALSVAMLPAKYVVFGLAGAMPFLVIAGIVGWRRLRAPGVARVARTVEAVRAMSWVEFSQALEAGFRRDGFTVARLAGGDADFEMTKGWRRVLVGCRRWKVARTGVEPLRELHAAKDAHEAHECLYVAVGELTDNARRFAAEKRIRLIEGPELALLLPEAGRR